MDLLVLTATTGRRRAVVQWLSRTIDLNLRYILSRLNRHLRVVRFYGTEDDFCSETQTAIIYSLYALDRDVSSR